MDVYVFKTSVPRGKFKQVAPILNQGESISKWNFDFSDCDNILRIESEQNISGYVCQFLHKFGYSCEELE